MFIGSSCSHGIVFYIVPLLAFLLLKWTREWVNTFQEKQGMQLFIHVLILDDS